MALDERAQADRRGRSPDRPSTRCGTIRVIDMATTQVTPAAFVQTLRDEVMGHAAVTHPFLHRFAQGGLAAWQLWGYASQHYQLVCFFTAYLEALTKHTPDQEIRRLVQEIRHPNGGGRVAPGRPDVLGAEAQELLRRRRQRPHRRVRPLRERFDHRDRPDRKSVV